MPNRGLICSLSLHVLTLKSGVLHQFICVALRTVYSRLDGTLDRKALFIKLTHVLFAKHPFDAARIESPTVDGICDQLVGRRQFVRIL